jgi:hypothetical protein
MKEPAACRYYRSFFLRLPPADAPVWPLSTPRPSKWVAVTKWDTSNDRFEEGQ